MNGVGFSKHMLSLYFLLLPIQVLLSIVFTVRENLRSGLKTSYHCFVVVELVVKIANFVWRVCKN